MSVNVGRQIAAEVFNSAMRPETDSMILEQYYREQDYISSPEAIMKVLSVILCIVSSVLLLSGGGVSCGGAARLPAGGAALALASAAALAALYAAAAFALPVYAPMPCFYTDLIASTVIGILLLVHAILNMTLCDLVFAIDYVHGPLGLLTAGLATSSAVVSYAAVTRRWDAARPDREPRRPPPHELEV